MVKYKESKSNIGIFGTTIAFIILATILIIIGYKNQVLSWLKTTGIVVLVITIPILFYFLYARILKKIKEM